MREIFKVRIIKAAKSGYWYSKNVGEIFEVIECDGPPGNYEVASNSDLFIKVDDCELVEEPTTKEEAEKSAKEEIRRETAAIILAGMMGNDALMLRMEFNDISDLALSHTDRLLFKLNHE